MALRDYIGETTAYDRKLQLERKDPASWLKSVSAFANTEGGKLLFGVADDGSPVGLADAQGDAEAISEASHRVGRRVPSPPAKGLCIRENGTSGCIMLGKVRHSHLPAVFLWNPLYRRAGTARPTHLKLGENTSFSTGNPTISSIGSSSTDTESGTPSKGAIDTITKTDTKTGSKTGSKAATDAITEVTTDVAPEVRRLAMAIETETSADRLMELVGIKQREDFRLRFLKPAIGAGMIEMTQPDSPRSPTQKYRLTAKGKKLASLLASNDNKAAQP
ncbi:MAG: ATP-binding protein [Kiritimatiellae bacterium]|nr:ATP-binding protein [Kiritimatiellia bacterium]MBR4190672.1 ATP-binding protein [Kiritimatiellia bacterium]